VRDFAERRRADVPTGLVHGDLFRDNVLWAETSSGCYTIAALLDFESAHDGPFVYDLAVTILSWSYGAEFDTKLASAIVRGYRSVRELEATEREALYDEAIFAALRFTITRITDDAIRVGKRWQRFVERREAIERLGRRGFCEVLGL
ncbi:MAG TPA: phosphotransferase, partial [Labilithrix sp.]|nr:phosphotransferase [Labilithrix sp.]